MQGKGKKKFLMCLRHHRVWR